MISFRCPFMTFLAAAFAVITGGMSLCQQYPQNTYQEMRWRMIGPFRGGRTRAACGVPGEPNVFYIGQVNGGVWKSDDYGRTWKPVFDKEPTQSIGAIAVAPSDSKVIYVASGEGLQRPDLSVGDGIYKSTDAGITWTHLGLRAGQQIPALAIDPHNSERLFAAVLGHPYGPNAQRGIFRSTDGGKNWEKVLYVNENTGGDDVVIDPANPSVVYATLWEARQGPWEDHNSYGGDDGGIFKSTDGGANWRKLTKGLPKGIVNAYVAIAPSLPSRLYATVAANLEGGYQTGEGLGIYRSDDAGETWRSVTTDPRPAFRIGGGDLAVPKVDPRNPDVVYSTSIETWKSTDAGKTWTAIRGAPGGDDYQNIWINPDHPNIILLVSDQGAIVTVNGGTTWSSWYNQPTAQLYHVIATNTFPYLVCGGQQESGSVCISSRGNDGAISFRDWQPVGVVEYGYVAPDPLNPNIIYGAGRNEVSRFHWDTGQVQNVTPIPVMEGKYRTDRTEPIIFSPIDHHLIYYAANVLFKTTDSGQSWQRISPDLSREHPGIPASLGALADKDPYARKVRGAIYAIAPSFKSAGTIWVGTDDGLIWLTRDGGNNWTNVTPPDVTPWSKVTQLVASHFDDETAYASVNRFRIDDLHPYIYRTHDGGKSWKLITAGLPDDAPVNTVREDLVRKGLLFSGTERAVWVSFDDGNHWQSLQLNLPHTSMRDLWIHDNDLIVGTHGRSFWILDNITPLRQITATLERSTAALFKPEPAIRVRRDTNTDTPLPPDEPVGQNPPNGGIIDYFLSESASGPVTIEILDAAGKLVRRYSSTNKPGLPEDQLKKVFIPLFWLQKPSVLSTEAGMHRWVWDLRYAPPKSEHFSYPISAIPHNTPRTPLGPLALPGVYTVQLAVDGHTFSAPLTVQMDPRVKASRSGLEQEFHMEMRLASVMDNSYTAIAEARALNDDLAKLPDRTKGLLAAPVAELKKKVAEVLSSPEASEDSGTAPPTLESVTAKASSLYEMVGGADATPTAAQAAALEALEQNIALVTKRWNEIKAVELPALNGRLRQTNHPELRLQPQPLPQIETRNQE